MLFPLKTKKKCISCNRTKPIGAFDFHNKDAGTMRNQCKSCRSIKQLERTYGITRKEYEDLLKKQEGRCAICNTKTPSKDKSFKRLFIDHCHTTGKVRGLLCSTCNQGLGLLKDDMNLLNNAILYLKNYGNSND